MFSGMEMIRILAALPVIFFAITVHEFSHAWMAVKCGDPTPARDGRITLNPLAHFDPFGVVFILLTVVSGFGFGWGRPVMINPANFRNPRSNELWVAAAGPISNLAQATVFALLTPFVLLAIYSFGLDKDVNLFLFFKYLLAYGITINLALAFFNLIPLFPLDGEKVLLQSLPWMHARKLAELRPHGMPILFGLILLGQFSNGRISPIRWWIEILSTPFMWVLTSISSGIMSLLYMIVG